MVWISEEIGQIYLGDFATDRILHGLKILALWLYRIIAGKKPGHNEIFSLLRYDIIEETISPTLLMSSATPMPAIEIQLQNQTLTLIRAFFLFPGRKIVMLLFEYTIYA